MQNPEYRDGGGPGQNYNPNASVNSLYEDRPEPRARFTERGGYYSPPDEHRRPGPGSARGSFDSYNPQSHQPRHRDAPHNSGGHHGSPGNENYPPPPGSVAGSERPYAPSEPRPTEGNMLAPYDEEKAYAEYTDAYGPPPWQEYDYNNGPPSQAGYGQDRRAPPSEYGRGGGYDDRDRRTRFDERSLSASDRYDSRERSRYHRRPSYDERDRRYYEDRERERDRDRARYARRPSKPSTGKDMMGSGDGDRGLASTILGGAAGALIGHETGKGALHTIGGIVVGALGANVIERQVEKREESKGPAKEPRRREVEHYRTASPDSYYGSRAPSRRY